MKKLSTLRRSQTWLTIVVLAMIMYQLLYAQFLLWDAGIHRVIHLGFSLVVVCLYILSVTSSLSRFKRPILSLMLAASVAITAYLVVNFPGKGVVFILPPPGIMVAGTIALILCLVLGWWEWGKVMPLITLVAILYAIVGPYFLPAVIAPPEVSLLRILSWIAGDVRGDWGVYGELVGFLANYIWLFMVFGAFLQGFGAMRFIKDFGILLSRKLASGPAMLSVITSALVGMVTGSTNANEAITGSFTIPLMKSHGYSPDQAAAVEMAASNGGQIMPPVMGVVAFVMAEFIGIPYVKVVLYATVPAVLYFFAVGLYVQLQAVKNRLTPLSEAEAKVSVRGMLLDAPLFFLPFAVLVFLLLKGFSLMFVAAWSTVAVLVISLVFSLLRKKKLDWRAAQELIVRGAAMACDVTVVCGVLGALTAILEMSGLAVSLGKLAIMLSGGNIFVLLVFTAIVGLILGTGLPTIAAYVFVAAVIAPPIIASGVPLVAVHFFILVYAVFANITPPIGVGIIVAQRLAGGTFWGTAREGNKAAFIAYFLPFFYIYTPAIMLQFEGLSLVSMVMQYVLVLTFLVSASFLISNCCFTTLNLSEKALFLIAVIFSLLSIPLSSLGWALVTVGIMAGVAGCRLSYQRSKRASPISEPSGVASA